MGVNLQEGQTLNGIVTKFDEHVGLGEIKVESSEDVLPFHCVNIADGSRSIRPDAQVSFQVWRHPLGRLEARDIAEIVQQL